MKSCFVAVLTIWIAIACGCSSSATNPVQPVDKPVNSAISNAVDTQRQLWGMWDIGIDLETLTATVAPDRDVENHFNVLPFLNPPKCTDCLTLKINSFDDVTRILDLDVTLRNKFAIDGFDVRGIVFTDDLGHLLKNEDAWTDLYEIPGGAPINPFIAYSKDDPQRKFAGLGTETENYRIWVPDPPKYIMIKYAVDASYQSNCTEPYAIGDFAQSKITNEVGSHGEVSIAVSDWQDDVDAVSLQAKAITGEDSTSMTHQSGNIWSVDLANNQGAAAGDYKVRIAATSTGQGTTFLYSFATITISEGVPATGWARTWGGTGADNGYGVAVDGFGNVYVTGAFSDTVDLDPATAGIDNHTSKGNMDIFLSKFDSSGNLIRAITWGGDAADVGTGVAVDGSNNVYVTGQYHDTVDFDPGDGVDSHKSNGNNDIFVSKFDSSGNFVWARTWGGSADDFSNGIDVDGSGNVYTTGEFANIVDFDPGSAVDSRISNGNYDIFLSRLDSSGDFAWVLTLGSLDDDVGYGVAVDGSNNIYVTGSFTNTVDFDPGSGADEHTSNASSDVFLGKYDSSGNFMWAGTWGAGGGDAGYCVAAKGSSFVDVSGLFGGKVDFDPGTGVDYHTSNGAMDIFLSQFDSSGNFQWARTWGSSGIDAGFAIAMDSSNNAYLTGWFSDIVDFDPGTGTDNLKSNGLGDVFISKLDSSGNYLWARSWGGSLMDRGQGVDVDGSGDAYVAGYFRSTVDFDPSAGVDSRISSGDTDAFFSKFLPDGNW